MIQPDSRIPPLAGERITYGIVDHQGLQNTFAEADKNATTREMILRGTIRLMPAKIRCLDPPSLTILKCLARHARNASGFFDLKAIPATLRMIPLVRKGPGEARDKLTRLSRCSVP